MAGWLRNYLFTAIILFSMTGCSDCIAQFSDTCHPKNDSIRKGRLTGVLMVQGTLYVSSVVGLYVAWYQDYPQSSFHLFGDAGEWMQVDKCGHAITTYYISRIGHDSYRWAGVSEKKATWFGGLLGFAYMLNIEILDGFSSGWGFSMSDMAANTLGSMMFISQQLAWHQQKFMLKYSFHQTAYAAYRPNLLGNNLIQNMIKDYNGHTYWISGNIRSFCHEESKFPKWLNVAVGYGAEGMTGAFSNAESTDGHQIPAFTRYRKFFLSVDVDLTRIPTKSPFLRTMFTLLSFIKIPAPAIGYSTQGSWSFYPLYY